MRMSSLARAFALSASLAVTPLALAQTETATPAAAAPATAAPRADATPSPTRALPPGFEPVPGGEARAEAVNANMLVVLAYAGFFLAMFGYIVHIVRRQATLSREIQELSSKLEKRS